MIGSTPTASWTVFRSSVRFDPEISNFFRGRGEPPPPPSSASVKRRTKGEVGSSRCLPVRTEIARKPNLFTQRVRVDSSGWIPGCRGSGASLSAWFDIQNSSYTPMLHKLSKPQAAVSLLFSSRVLFTDSEFWQISRSSDALGVCLMVVVENMTTTLFTQFNLNNTSKPSPFGTSCRLSRCLHPLVGYHFHT